MNDRLIVPSQTDRQQSQNILRSPEVRDRVYVPWLMAAEGLYALPDLLALLQAPDWQMRAIVTRALIGLGAAVVEAVKPLVHAHDHGVRVAAVQVLMALGQDAWVAEQIIPDVAVASG